MKIETAKEVYKLCDPWYKTVLEEEFGKVNFVSKEFPDIKTFDDACQALGTTEEKFNEKWNALGLPNDTLFYEKLKLVTKALNGGWVPDWSDSNQPKWFNYFEVHSSGAGFSSPGTYDNCRITHVGSRLCFESQKKAEHARKYFENFYSQFLLITE